MQSITLKVRRTTSVVEDDGSFWQSFAVPFAGDSMSVLDGLIWVQRNADPTLAFRCACRVGMCGTCGVVINGREGLACRTLMRTLVSDGNSEVRVEPMRHLPVIRDLATDMSVFHAKLRKAASLGASESSDNGFAAISPGSTERQVIDPQRECIYCGLCYSACTVVGLNEDFLGPAALNRAFVMLLDSRSVSTPDDLNAVANEQGLWRCHTLFECTAVCPKGISPTLAIQRLKKKVIGQKLKRLFRIAR